MREKLLFSNWSLTDKPDINRGDIIKMLDDVGNTIEHAYLLNDPVKENGLFFADVRTQATNKTIRICITNAIQKI
jgi:hypothetical protein